MTITVWQTVICQLILLTNSCRMKPSFYRTFLTSHELCQKKQKKHHKYHRLPAGYDLLLERCCDFSLKKNQLLQVTIM